MELCLVMVYVEGASTKGMFDQEAERFYLGEILLNLEYLKLIYNIQKYQHTRHTY